MSLLPATFPPDLTVKAFAPSPPGVGFVFQVAQDGSLAGFYVERDTPASETLEAMGRIGFDPDAIKALSGITAPTAKARGSRAEEAKIADEYERLVLEQLDEILAGESDHP